MEDRVRQWLLSEAPEAAGCSLRATRATGDRIYAACGHGGLWIFLAGAAEPRPNERRHFGGQVTGLFEQRGQLWAVVERTEALPIAVLDPASVPLEVEALPPVSGASTAPVLQIPRAAVPPAAARASGAGTPQPAPKSKRVGAPDGKVVGRKGRDVVINLGLDHGVRPGTRVEFVAPRAERDEDEMAEPALVQLAVGTVRAAASGRARVGLGMNENVPLGSVARPSQAPLTASTAAPDRAAGLWAFSGIVRPFVALGELGGGFLLDSFIGYRFEHGLHVQGVIEPLGFATANSAGVVTASAFFFVGYDTRWFEVGTGLGIQTVNEPDYFEEKGTGLLVPQRLRLGALDGLQLELRSDVVLFRQRFEFGGMRGSLQVPIGNDAWYMVFRGGGGISGYGFGEVGIRLLLSGNGSSGSSFVTVTVGGLSIFGQGVCDFTACEPNRSYGGPSVGLGIERRF